MQIEVGVLKLIRKGTGGLGLGEDSVELELITVALSRMCLGAFYLPVAGGAEGFLCEIRSERRFPSCCSASSPQDGSQHSDYLCIFKHGTIYFLKSLMYS